MPYIYGQLIRAAVETMSSDPSTVADKFTGRLWYNTTTDLLKYTNETNDVKVVLTSGDVVNADINASAAIAYSKLAALTADRALISSGAGAVSVSSVTATEIGYVSGVTSAIQTQLNTKLSYTANQYGVVLSGAANVATVLAPDASTSKVLISGGASANPSWGTVAIGGGGTGATTKSGAFDALSPMTTGGDLIYGGASGTGTRLANGSSGQVLTSNGGTAAPSWQTPGSSFGQQEVRALGFNGKGAVNTEIFRFNAPDIDVGTDITYADSANDGGSFTIETAGVYAIYMQGRASGVGDQFFIVKNATAFTSGTSANTLLHWEQPIANQVNSSAVTAYFSASDVIRFGLVGSGPAQGHVRVVRVN